MTQSSGRLDRYFRHRRWYEALLWSAYFLGEATANSITVSMDFRREQLHFASWEAIVWEYSSCLTLLALVPGVLALERRFPFRFTGWREKPRRPLSGNPAFQPDSRWRDGVLKEAGLCPGR